MPLDLQTTDPIFSLDKDLEGLVNARRTFVELGDPTGYLWTKAHLDGDQTHWEMFWRAPWFRSEVDEWIKEIKKADKVQALKRIREIAFSPSDSGIPAATVLAASRYLAEAGYEPKDTGRGRPSKEELKGELKKLAHQLSEEDQDLQRMGLQVIQGGK